ncbi:hypothetical protein AG1IA_09921 [Rhizoctonia solani AG-1 IA]|uniref:Uncharacterized protein n=1 Tax=Thanatephorus cucumeris (strain AG1-IA) TaxID=983506 RepID=L8WI49_THACA|nr:hypothetical protein AG1IA_09921 [Rhizoctonia solani AG-1 IA]
MATSDRAQYDERFAMVPTDAQIGWGTSVRKAEENSAQNLMMSGYCVSLSLSKDTQSEITLGRIVYLKAEGGSSTRPSDHAYTPFGTLTKRLVPALRLMCSIIPSLPSAQSFSAHLYPVNMPGSIPLVGPASGVSVLSSVRYTR